MTSGSSREAQRQRRHLRVRKKISGTADRPRLVVFRSDKHTYAQLVDDDAGRTLATVSSLKVGQGKKSEKAAAVGKQVAAVAKDKGITRVVFDRGGSQNPRRAE